MITMCYTFQNVQYSYAIAKPTDGIHKLFDGDTLSSLHGVCLHVPINVRATSALSMHGWVCTSLQL